MKLKSIGVVVLGLNLWLLAGCSHESADWKSATTADTSQAYQQFLTQHPKSANAAQAQTRIQQLREEHDWQVATAADTREGYEQFLAQHADSLNAQEARIRIENFAQSATTTSVAALNKSHVATTSVGAHYVQLGAFSSQAHAESQWKRLSAKFSRELSSLTPRYLAGKSHAGAVIRLQVAVNSRAQGKALCEKLRAHAQTCVTVSAG
jgi:hypothetical protein